MSRTIHKILNATLPMSVRRVLKRGALSTIPSLRHLDMPLRLRSLAKAGFQPSTIYDIGCATGDWARMAHSIWPRARIIGFEPNQSRISALERTRTELPRFDYHRCFLGSVSREGRYTDRQDQTSLYLASSSDRPSAAAPMLVLDELIGSGRIPEPDLMKLDVQGYELEVLRGGAAALRSCQVAVLECNFYHLSPRSPTIRDVLEFMWSSGFFWFDIAGILRRDRDDAIAHLDLIFVKQGHPLLRDNWE